MKKPSILLIAILCSVIFIMGMIDPTRPPAAKKGGQEVNVGVRLQGIFITNNTRVAIVDQQIVMVGQYLPDGSRITNINKDSVEIAKSNNEKELLKLPNTVLRNVT